MCRSFTCSVLAFVLAACGAAVPGALGSVSAAAGQPTVLDAARASGSFKTLAAALDAAGLVAPLEGPGPFTVFAPTDAAFAKLGQETLDSLLEPRNREKLQSILKYHVVPDRLDLEDLKLRAAVRTLADRELPIRSRGQGVEVAGVVVAKADIRCSNGVIHVVDEVLLPPGEDDADAVQGAAGLIALAISRGAPAFNAGRLEHCRDVYLVTAVALVGGEWPELSVEARGALRGAIRDAGRQSDLREQAWTLRRGLDAAFEVARERGAMSR